METFSRARKSALALAAVGVLAAYGTPVSAGVLATSIMQLDKIVFSKSDGAAGWTPLSAGAGGDFSFVVFSSGMTTDAVLNGVSSPANQSVGVTVVPVNLPVACIGACPAAADNVYPVYSSGLGHPSTTFALADQNEAGAPIANLPGFPAAAGATVENGAYASLTTASTAISTSVNQLTASWQFVPNFTGKIRLSYDALAYLEAFVSPGEPFPATAQASYSVSWRITDDLTGDVVALWQPDGDLLDNAGSSVGLDEIKDDFSQNTTVGRLAPLSVGAQIASGFTLGAKQSGSFEAITLNDLVEGRAYSLSAANTTIARGTSLVPEPDTLALLGVSLVGLAALRRNRACKK